jgi:hypothetical protein
MIEIRKQSTQESNISLRSITYDIYQDGRYVITCWDICDALDKKEEMEAVERLRAELVNKGHRVAHFDDSALVGYAAAINFKRGE